MLQEIQKQGYEPTIELILSSKDLKPEKNEKNHNNFLDLVQEYADNCFNKEGEESYNTQRLYLSLKRFLEKHYGPFIDIKEINSKEGFRHYVSILNKEKRDKNPMKNRMITWFLTVLKYAQDNNYIDAVRVGKVTRFDETPNHDKLNLKTEEITELIRQFKKIVNVKHPKYDKFSVEEIALYLWILHIMFQGINNVDMFKLRKRDVKVRTIKKLDVNTEKYFNNPEYQQDIDNNQEEKEVIEININRKKVTNAPTKILVDKDTIEPLLELFYYDKEDDEYLVHNKLDYRQHYSDADLTKARTSFYNIKQDQLNRIWKSFFIKDDWGSLPVLTFAHTRHAFINRLNDLEVKQNIISKFVGHQRITLDYYIDKRIPEWEHSNAISLIFNEETSVKALMEERDKKREEHPERKNNVYKRQDYGKNFYVTIEKYRKNKSN